GVDFFVSAGEAGRFIRFPSGDRVGDEATVHVVFADGYDGIWLPMSPPLAAPPTFTGDRADALADGFYVNRDSDAAIAVPDGAGVEAGDGYTARMSREADPAPGEEPVSTASLIDLDAMPQLARWLAVQQL